VAAGGFHSQAGWLAFNAVALGLVAGARNSRFFTRAAPESRTENGPNPAAAYLVPFLAVVGTALVTGVFSSGFDWLYPLRVVAGALALWVCRKAYTGWRWTLSWQALAIRAGTALLWIVLVSFQAPANREATALSEDVPAVWAALWWCFRGVGYVVIMPVIEELAFRGYLLRRLQAADFEEVSPGRFSWLSFLVSSGAFGALHGRCWLAGTTAGMLFALALYRRGRLADAVTAHAATNSLIAAYVLATGNWSL
jgi:exosortase E/protease (VPEID-CTERM system)